MAINGLVNFDINPVVVQTTDDSTLTTILTASAFGTTDDGSQLVTLDVTGFDFINNEMVSAKIAVKLKQVSGTPSIVGTPVHLIPINAGSSTALSTASIVPTIDGTNLKVNVYGVSGRTIDWTCNRANSLQILENLTAPPTIDDGYVIKWDATNERWEAGTVEAFANYVGAGGDLAGTYPNPTVAKITGATSGNTNFLYTSATNKNLTIQIPNAGTTSDTYNFSIQGQNATGTTPYATGGDIIIGPGQGGDQNGVIKLGNIYCSRILMQGQKTSAGSNVFTIDIDARGGTSALTAVLTGAISMTGSAVTLSGSSSVTATSATQVNFNTPKVKFGGTNTYTTSSTVGSAGGASALPATPSGYITVDINGTDYKIPYYAT
jgi:hypothetical protein